MRVFLHDQYETYHDQPFTLYRITTLNGKTDSALVSFSDIDWGPVFAAFSNADIGKPEFLNHYRFQVFDDARTGNRSLFYEAKDPDLFTRQLQINIDPANNRIQSVYLETDKTSRGLSRQQRLMYIPLHIIQIQEDESGTPGGGRHLRVEYKFLS